MKSIETQHSLARRLRMFPQLFSLAALSMPSLAQESEQECAPADDRAVCVAKPDNAKALDLKGDIPLVVFVPGVANNGASRVQSSVLAADMRGLPMYGVKNDTGHFYLHRPGSISGFTSALSDLIGLPKVVQRGLLENAIVADLALMIVSGGPREVPYVGITQDLVNAAKGLIHPSLGAKAEESVQVVSNLVLDAIEKGTPLELYCHSQGGIIVGNALAIARNRGTNVMLSDSEWLEKASRVSVRAFGTPQQTFNVKDAIAFEHSNDPVLVALERLGGLEGVSRDVEVLRALTKERYGLILTPEITPTKVVLSGDVLSGKHEFAHYLSNMDKFLATMLRQQSDGRLAAKKLQQLKDSFSREVIQKAVARVLGDGPESRFVQDFVREVLTQQRIDALSSISLDKPLQDIMHKLEQGILQNETRLRGLGLPASSVLSDLMLPRMPVSSRTNSKDQAGSSQYREMLLQDMNASASRAAAMNQAAQTRADADRGSLLSQHRSQVEAELGRQASAQGHSMQHRDAVQSQGQQHRSMVEAPSLLTDTASQRFQAELQSQLAAAAEVREAPKAQLDLDKGEKKEENKEGEVNKNKEGARADSQDRKADRPKSDTDSNPKVEASEPKDAGPAKPEVRIQILIQQSIQNTFGIPFTQPEAGTKREPNWHPPLVRPEEANKGNPKIIIP